MDTTFEISDPDEHHPNHFMVVATLESGETLDVISFKDRRACVVLVDKLRMIVKKRVDGAHP